MWRQKISLAVTSVWRRLGLVGLRYQIRSGPGRSVAPQSPRASGPPRPRKPQLPEVLTFFWPIGLAGMPAAMTPAETDFEATPMEPTIASASIVTPERTTAW